MDSYTRKVCFDRHKISVLQQYLLFLCHRYTMHFVICTFLILCLIGANPYVIELFQLQEQILPLPAVELNNSE